MGTSLGFTNVRTTRFRAIHNSKLKISGFNLSYSYVVQPEGRMAKLVVTGSDGQTREFDIDREMTLGRHDGNDVVVKEEKASRRHCRVKPRADRVMLEDLKSSNGTRVNGHRIKAEYVLKHGDAITIGGTKIVFQDPTQENLDRTMVLPSDAEPE